MYGNILTNPDLLQIEDKKYYSSCYCGLCRASSDKHKQISRLTINYDMTFLIVLLNEVYKEKNTELKCRCALHPLKKRTYLKGKFIDYVADMNVLLAYYNLIDDWNDDKNVIAGSYAALLKTEFNKVCSKYPRKAEVVKKNLNELSKIEKKNILNPDLPAKCCGNLFGEVFSPYEDEFSKKLKDFGNSLGKFVYIEDACIDLNSDIKHKRYNPLITSSKLEFDDMLNLLLADCIENYKKLNISNKILENVLYSGIWTKYEIYKKKGEKNK